MNWQEVLEQDMDVKEAVHSAKEHIADLFAGEEIMHVGLEEVEFDHSAKTWKITIGFSRPWDRRFGNTLAVRERHPTRSYKVVNINDESGQAESIRDRFMVDSRVN